MYTIAATTARSSAAACCRPRGRHAGAGIIAVLQDQFGPGASPVPARRRTLLAVLHPLPRDPQRSDDGHWSAGHNPAQTP